MIDVLTFHSLIIQNSLTLDLSDDVFPTRVLAWNGGALDLRDGDTHYGMVTHGKAHVEFGGENFALRAGMFFVLPEAGRVGGEGSAGMVISRLDYRGLFQIGGPLEGVGRLRYIDGCSDTLLACPALLGAPCLNHLHIPPHTRQSSHTHSSTRLGIIVSGSGECHTPEGVFPLSPGMGWYIPAGCRHAFMTVESTLDAIAWHPDSEFGPTHERHPMVSRTFVDGVSASELPGIRTKEIL